MGPILSIVFTLQKNSVIYQIQPIKHSKIAVVAISCCCVSIVKGEPYLGQGGLKHTKFFSFFLMFFSYELVHIQPTLIYLQPTIVQISGSALEYLVVLFMSVQHKYNLYIDWSSWKEYKSLSSTLHYKPKYVYIHLLGSDYFFRVQEQEGK